MIPTDPEPVVPVPKSHTNTCIKEEVERRWNLCWNQLQTARQSRLFWPIISKQRTDIIMLCDRRTYSDVVRTFTGHNNMNRHCNLTGETDSAECRLCNEDEESSSHLLLDCPALSGVRSTVLGSHTVDAHEFQHLPLDGIRRFISLMRRALVDEGLEQI